MRRGNPIQSVTDFVIRFRWGVFALVLVLSAWLGFLGSRLPTDNSYDGWLPEDDYVTVLYQETDREFANNALVFVVLFFPEKGVFHPDSLAEVARFTELLESVPELFFVMSLTNVMDIRALEDGIRVGSLVREIPYDAREMAELRDYVLSREMYANSVVSADARYTTILMNIDGDHDEVKVAARVLEELERNAGDTLYYFGGDPALAHYMDLYMVRDLSVLLPIMVVVMMFILGFGLRRFWGVVLPLVVVTLTILWTIGIKQILGMPMNLLTPAVMVMLIALGSDYAVHSMNHCMRARDLARAGGRIGAPILMSAVTTIAGLLTFGTTQILILKNFGYGLVIGLATACLLTVTFLVAMMRIVRLRPKAEPGVVADPEEAGTDSGSLEPDHDREGDHLFARFLGFLTERILRHTRLFLLGVAVLVVVAGLGIFRIHTNVDFVTFLPEKSPPRVGHEILQDHFGGIYPVSIYVRGDIEEPSVLALMLRMENLLRGYPVLSGFTSTASLLAEMNRLLTGAYAVPEDRAGVAGLWLLMEDEPYLKTLVNEERDKTLVNALVGRTETDVMKDAARFMDETLPVGKDNEVLTLNPARLSPEGLAALRAVERREAALQLAALAAWYGGQATPPASHFEEKIRDVEAEAAAMGWSEGIEASLRSYLRHEAVWRISGPLEDRVAERFRRHFPGDDPEAWAAGVRELLTEREGVDRLDAELIQEGALWRCRQRLRAEQAERFLAAFAPGLPDTLQGSEYFLRRAKGVVWELTRPRPVVLASAARGIPGLDSAVEERVPVRIDQAGAPDVFRKFDQLLYRSQVQSLALATLVVFTLISVIQRSLRRGLIAVAAVLVPLEIVIGMMGWLGIPLDFGTALSGALIIGLGVDGCIHVLHYQAILRARGVPEDRSLILTLRHVGRAVLTANVTTAGGFAVMLFSMTSAVRNFSVVNVGAILLVTASIVTLLPVLIKVSHVFTTVPRAEGGPPPRPAAAEPGSQP